MSIKSNNQPVAENITKIISDAGLKQWVIAERTGFDAQTFSDMLNGRRLIKMCDVMKIANALGVTPNDLYGIVEEKDAR